MKDVPWEDWGHLRMAMAREFEMQAAREANRLIHQFFYALRLLSWDQLSGYWPKELLREGLGGE